jgi:transposase
MEHKFQEYNQHQGLLLPPRLDEFIEEHALVRVVNRVVDKVRLEVLEAPFEGGGRPAFHPRMMLKVIVFAYCSGTYSCRKIALALRRDVAFMWLSGMQQPDFRTINRFRSEYFKEVVGQVFEEVAALLVCEGYIRSRDYFVDGTKLPADAHKHSAVWKKNAERYKELARARAREILKEVEELNRKEDEELGEKDLPECGGDGKLGSAEVEEVAEGINRALEGKTEDARARKLKRCTTKLKKEGEKLALYEEQERVLGGRNSYSKTDPDASFMRMKDGELRAGYNLQVGTQDGFITGCSVHQNANDGATLKEHLKAREERDLPPMDRAVTDSGYGSEENYIALEEAGVEAYLGYRDFRLDEKNRHGPYHHSRFAYDKARDRFTCPAGRSLSFRCREERKQNTGFEYQVDVYECESCAGCPFREACVKGQGSRRIYYNHRLQALKAKAFERLTSPEGVALRRARGNACESPFGDLKHNQRITRFRLRGLAKVSLEAFFLSISYNLRKLFGKEVKVRRV